MYFYTVNQNMSILHFDTITSNYIQNDPFNTRFTLANAIHRVRSIQLKSLELPVGFFNVRNSGTLNIVTISINNVDYSITLSPKNYTTASNLCTDINTLFSGVTFATASTVTFSAAGSYINVALTSTGITQFSIVDTQLSNYILGLKSSNNAAISGGTTASITASSVINLNVDNYLNMYLENVPTDNNYNFNGILCSFKVSLNGVYGNIIYNNDETVFKQTVFISDENFILRELRICIFDRFGNPIVNNGLDYSFSLEIKNFVE